MDINLLNGFLKLKEKKIKGIMIPINEVFRISKKENFNKDLVEKITKANYSNVLIYKN